MANRIVAAIAAREAKLRDKFADGIGLNGEPIDDLHETLEISWQDFVGFQGAQARAHVSGRITSDEAATIYAVLGGEVYRDGWPDGTSLATKLVITQVMGELIGVRA